MMIDHTELAIVGVVALMFTLGWLIFSAVVRAIARSEFRRMFKGTMMVRGKRGRFERL